MSIMFSPGRGRIPRRCARSRSADMQEPAAPVGAVASAATGASRELLAEGAVVLRGFARLEAASLVAAVAKIAAISPFRQMTTPGGFRMSVAMTNCGAAGWITDRAGYRYERVDPATGRAWPPLPSRFRALAARAAAMAGFAVFVPDACLINRYNPTPNCLCIATRTSAICRRRWSRSRWACRRRFCGEGFPARIGCGGSGSNMAMLWFGAAPRASSIMGWRRSPMATIRKPAARASISRCANLCETLRIAIWLGYRAGLLRYRYRWFGFLADDRSDLLGAARIFTKAKPAAADCSGIGPAYAVFEDRHRIGNALELVKPDRMQAPVCICERPGHIAGYCAAYIMDLGRVLHARGDVDRAAIDPDGTLGVALLADDHIAAMHPDAKARHHPELGSIGALLATDRREYRVQGSQYSIVAHRLSPIPDRDQPVALVEINLAAEIGDRFCNIEQKFADQRLDLERAEPFGQRGRVVNIDKH